MSGCKLVAYLPFAALSILVPTLEAIQSPNPESEPRFEAAVLPFLQQHCIPCHGEDKREAEFRIDTLSRDFANERAVVPWLEVAVVIIAIHGSCPSTRFSTAAQTPVTVVVTADATGQCQQPII